MKWFLLSALVLSVLVGCAYRGAAAPKALPSKTSSDAAGPIEAPESVSVSRPNDTSVEVSWVHNGAAEIFRLESCLVINVGDCDPDSDAWIEEAIAMGTKRMTSFHYDSAVIPAGAREIRVRVSTVFDLDSSVATLGILAL